MSVPKGHSLSEEWREKGNEHYRTVTEALSPAIQIKRLQEALSCYDRAITTATHVDEKSSALKNKAMANWKIAKATMRNQATDRSSKTITFYFKEALKSFQNSKDQGGNRGHAWHDALVSSALGCWSDVHSRIDEWEYEDRIREIEQLLPYVIDDLTQAQEYLEIANHYFHWSVTNLGIRDYQQCLHLLAECNFPLNEAERLAQRSGYPTVARECQLLQEDIFTQRCVAESIQARVRGEDLLQYVMQGEEILNIDLIWEVVDWFRNAAMLTRERDLEMEAMALSALGKVYDKVLKLKDRAKSCLVKVIELANTMVPRNFTGEEWYEFARATLEKYQQEVIHLEEEKHQKERQATLDLLKEELGLLKTKFSDMGKMEFLKFLYETHPPKNKEHKLGEVSSTPEWSELKKLYQKAVIHYHPDKVQVDEHGIKWKVLTEEITKLLTSHYEFYKGCS